MENKLPELMEPYEIKRTDTYSGKRLYGTFLYSDSRDITVKTEDEEFILRIGEVVYFRPMTWFGTDEGDMTELCIDVHCLELPFAYVKDVYQVFAESFGTENYILISEDAAEKIKRLSDVLENEQNSFSFTSYATLMSIVGLLIYVNEDNKIPEQSSFYSITEYIDTHSADPLEAGKLAEMCGMSYPNFAKRFHEHYGRSCKEHISHIRTVKARRLLRNSNLDLSAIAAETGFFDSSHFIRTYKKLMGTTPHHGRNMP